MFSLFLFFFSHLASAVGSGQQEQEKSQITISDIREYAKTIRHFHKKKNKKQRKCLNGFTK